MCPDLAACVRRLGMFLRLRRCFERRLRAGREWQRIVQLPEWFQRAGLPVQQLTCAAACSYATS